ncbi:MAG TPA: phosphatase PAP2 family protein [Longimicrobium sp.]|nr:phosphatase PAP2 family protein [Longimicrobium sp.]
MGCDRTVAGWESLPPLDPAGMDADAGSWRMFVLSSAGQIAVPAPASVESEAYRAELAAVRAAQARLTAAQRRNVQYWSGGGVLRWNQVMRELVARFNLPPAPRPDGTYPVPDAENPFSDPQFPFANPPYAARAYSYVSVAQYETLKSAWYWKFRYNRPSPARVDSSVRALVPVGELPAYPSEDAVLSGVTAEMLKLLFPAAVEEITRLAAQQREAAVLSGRATASDVAAGLALGKAVAAAVTAAAGADGMRGAVGTPAQWQALADSAAARGEVPWVSQESPARPPMLPNFGLVRAWTMTAAEVSAAQPAAPPSTSSARMAEEVEEVRRTVEGLTREQLAIAHRWNDGAGTYTPPGHWNDIAAEHVRDARMSEVRAARAFALLNMAMHDAAVGCWAVKYRWFNPRPTQLDPRIKTVVGLPNFPAYPSGHSTFSAAASEILGYLFPYAADDFAALAEEAGISRLYGGIHYRSDIEEGKAHGARVGRHVVGVAIADGSGGA